VTRFVYREALELVGTGCRVSGGQGDWIVIAGNGPDGTTETAVRRESLSQLASMLNAMHAYLAEKSA
jgi:hypothetical protein